MVLYKCNKDIGIKEKENLKMKQTNIKEFKMLQQ